MGVFICLAAFNSGNNVFYLVASSLFAITILSKVEGRRRLARARIAAYPPAEGLFARQEGVVSFLLQTESPLHVLLNHPSFASPLHAPAVPGGSGASVRFRPRARGLEPLSSLTVTSRGPYGVTRQRRRTPLPLPLVVFPEPAAGFDLTSMLRRRRLGDERRSSNDPGEGHEFLSLREYRPEDGMRRVHWKGLAKTGQLLSRVYERDEHVTLTFHLDTAIPEDSPEWRHRFERAVSELAAAIVQAHSRALAFRLTMPHRSTPVGSGLRHRNAVLSELAIVEPLVRPGGAIVPASGSVLTFAAREESSS